MGHNAYVGSITIVFLEVGVGREPRRNQEQSKDANQASNQRNTSTNLCRS